MGLPKFANWVDEQVTSVVTGVLEGVQQIFSGNIIEGFLNVITLGAYGNLKDWIDGLDKDTPEATYKDRKRTTRAATTPRQVIYGRVRTGGQLVYIGSTGDDSRYLHMIIAVAPHEVESIDQIYFNDELVSQGTTPVSKYSDNLDVIIKNGDQTSADSTIVSRISEWTSNHKLLGIAYVYVRLEYDDEIFSSGVPNVTAVIRGKNDIYDPRTDTSGYTNNHALCLANYLQSDFGVRATDDEIDWDSFAAAADVSDELFAGKGRQEVLDFNDSVFPWNWTWEIVDTEARYSVDGMVSTAASIVDNLNSLAHAGAATLVYTQGVWSITAGSYTAPDASHYFDESDLVGGIQFSPGPGKSNLINTAKGTYIDPRQDYEPVSFPEISPSAYVTQDGEELAVDIPMPFAQSPTMARRLGKIAIERERFGVSAEVTLKYTAAGVRVGDRIGLSITRLGWTNKIFMVENLNFSLGGGIGLSLREDAQDVWDWDAGEALEVVPPPATNIPEREAIAAPTGLFIDQTVNEPLRAYGNETTIRFSATAPADSRFAYIKFQYRLEGDLQWIDIRYDVADSASITVFADGRDYELSAQSVSIQGVVSNARLTDKFTVALINRTQQDNLPAAVTVPPVRGLRISNNIDNDDGWNQWKGPDVIFKWNETSQTAAGNIVDVNGVTDLHLKGYKVQIVNNLGGEVLREALLQTPEFTYTLTMNRRDTNNNPIRSGIKCVVTAATTTGYQSAAKSIVVSNPPPPALEALSVSPGFSVIEISYLRPDDLDFAGVDIWISQTQGFDPDATDPTATVSDNSYVASGLTQGETYYVRLRPFDLFGKTGTNTSAEFAVTTKTGTDITGLSGWAYEIDPVDRAFIQNNVEGGAIDLTDTQVGGELASGKLADLAVTAGKLADGSVALAGNKVTGELQRINLADLAVNAQKLEDLAVEAGKLASSSVTATKIANLAVGTAAIANAAITNAKIGNLAVDTAQIANAAIDSAKIANLAVGTAAVQDAAIVNAKINNLAVTDAKIQDVTAAKITTGSVLATETITSEGVIRAVDDVASPVVQAGIGPATFGTATTYLMWAYNGTDRTFSVDELGNVSVTGSITIAAGSTGVANLSDAGTLATKSSADWATEVAGTGKPANNADVTDYAAAAATAQQKADDAQTAAENYTNIREQAMIDGVITDAEQNAINAAAIDATNKANAAESAAESAAQLYTDRATIVVPSVKTASDLSFTNGTTHVKGETDVVGFTCSGRLTYADALSFAHSIGARLPTIEEIEGGLIVAGTGCGYDNELIWSQTKSGEGKRWVHWGKPANFPADSRISEDEGALHYVRLVADVSNTTISAATTFTQGWSAENADVTGDNTAASITGQGSLATLNSVDWDSTLDNIPDRVSDTATTGLNLTDTYIGYYDGTDFRTYIQSNGNFHFGETADNFIDFNGTQLVIDTDNFSVDGSGNATFSGELSAATGTFGGNLSAAGGTFSGALSAATGTFSGALSAATGTFSGELAVAKIDADKMLIKTPNQSKYGKTIAVFKGSHIYTGGGSTDTTIPIGEFELPGSLSATSSSNNWISTDNGVYIIFSGLIQFKQSQWETQYRVTDSSGTVASWATLDDSPTISLAEGQTEGARIFPWSFGVDLFNIAGLTDRKIEFRLHRVSSEGSTPRINSWRITAWYSNL